MAVRAGPVPKKRRLEEFRASRIHAMDQIVKHLADLFRGVMNLFFARESEVRMRQAYEDFEKALQMESQKTNIPIEELRKRALSIIPPEEQAAREAGIRHYEGWLRSHARAVPEPRRKKAA